MKPQLGISTLYEDIFKSMENCKNKMLTMEQTLGQKLIKLGQVKCRCKCILKQSLSSLKQVFNSFSQQWKIQMPMMLSQFLEITQKISEAYQQKIQKLIQEKQKWQFSYLQIVQTTNQKQKKQYSYVQKDNMLNQMMGKQAENSIFLQQKITQLFDQQESIPLNSEKQRQNKFYIEQRQSSDSKNSFWSNLNNQITTDISKRTNKQNSKKTGKIKQKNQIKDQQLFNKLQNIRKSFYSKNRNSIDKRI